MPKLTKGGVASRVSPCRSRSVAHSRHRGWQQVWSPHRDEEEKLDDQHPLYLKSVPICNQVIYGTISGTFKNGAGNEVKIDKKL